MTRDLDGRSQKFDTSGSSKRAAEIHQKLARQPMRATRESSGVNSIPETGKLRRGAVRRRMNIIIRCDFSRELLIRIQLLFFPSTPLDTRQSASSF